MHRGVLTLLLMMTGCSAWKPACGDVVLFVPGAAGNGPWYEAMLGAIRKQGHEVRVVEWGAPPPLTVLNFQDRAIHATAERKLASRIVEQRRECPDSRITLLGHSAGGGVILGAMARLPEDNRVDRAILLHPSVSPTYDLAPALQHVHGQLHVFHSDRDTVFLRWRTSTFGTYDNIRTEAAGKTGFYHENEKLVQHAYQSQWEPLGNDGGHFGPTAGRFVAEQILPLLSVSSP